MRTAGLAALISVLLAAILAIWYRVGLTYLQAFAYAAILLVGLTLAGGSVALLLRRVTPLSRAQSSFIGVAGAGVAVVGFLTEPNSKCAP